MPLTASRPDLLPGGDDQLLRRAIHDALAFGARLQELRTRLGEIIGLSGPAYTVLIAIEHLSESDEVGVSRVAEHLHLSGAFVTLEVGKLVKSGLVSKTPHPEDGRRVILRVTKKAEALLGQLAEVQRPVNDSLFSHLDARQFRAFVEIMALMVSGADEGLALLGFIAEQRRRPA